MSQGRLLAAALIAISLACTSGAAIAAPPHYKAVPLRLNPPAPEPTAQPSGGRTSVVSRVVGTNDMLVNTRGDVAAVAQAANGALHPIALRDGKIVDLEPESTESYSLLALGPAGHVLYMAGAPYQAQKVTTYRLAGEQTVPVRIPAGGLWCLSSGVDQNGHVMVVGQVTQPGRPGGSIATFYGPPGQMRKVPFTGAMLTADGTLVGVLPAGALASSPATMHNGALHRFPLKTAGIPLFNGRLSDMYVNSSGDIAMITKEMTQSPDPVEQIHILSAKSDTELPIPKDIGRQGTIARLMFNDAGDVAAAWGSSDHTHKQVKLPGNVVEVQNPSAMLVVWYHDQRDKPVVVSQLPDGYVGGAQNWVLDQAGTVSFPGAAPGSLMQCRQGKIVAGPNARTGFAGLDAQDYALGLQMMCRNSRGDAVFRTSLNGPGHNPPNPMAVVLWRDGVFYDVNELATLPAGLAVKRVTALSDCGTILCMVGGANRASGVPEEPYALVAEPAATQP